MIKLSPTDNRTVAEVVQQLGGNVKGEASQAGVFLTLRSDEQDWIDQAHADEYDRHERRADEFAQYWRAGQ